MLCSDETKWHRWKCLAHSRGFTETKLSHITSMLKLLTSLLIGPGLSVSSGTISATVYSILQLRSHWHLWLDTSKLDLWSPLTNQWPSRFPWLCLSQLKSHQSPASILSSPFLMLQLSFRFLSPQTTHLVHKSLWVGSQVKAVSPKAIMLVVCKLIYLQPDVSHQALNKDLRALFCPAAWHLWWKRNQVHQAWRWHRVPAASLSLAAAYNTLSNFIALHIKDSSWNKWILKQSIFKSSYRER